MKLPPGSRSWTWGPRDGLQNESAALSVEDRVGFSADRPGLPGGGAGSFRVAEVGAPDGGQSGGLQGAAKRPRPSPMLVPEPAGLRPGEGRGRSAIAIFTATSTPSILKNTNASIDRSIRRFRRVHERRKEAGYVDARLHLHLLRLPLRGKGPGREGRGDSTAHRPRMRRGLARRHHRRRGPVADRRGHRGGHAQRRSVTARRASPRHPGHRARERPARPSNSASRSSTAPRAASRLPTRQEPPGNLATGLLYALHGMGIETGVDLAKVAAASRASASGSARTAEPLPQATKQQAG